MADSGTWGTDFEMSVLAHLLQTIVYSYNTTGGIGLLAFPKALIKPLRKMSDLSTSNSHNCETQPS